MLRKPNYARPPNVRCKWRTDPVNIMEFQATKHLDKKTFMKKLIVILSFLTSGLFGQDNPMFDSLDYFERNKIKTIYCTANSWWYAFPFKSWQISFDKDKKTMTNHSYVPRHTDDKMAMAISSAEPTSWNFKYRDTIIKAPEGEARSETKYLYDNKGRLQKIISTTFNVPSESQYGFRYSENKDSNKTNSVGSQDKNSHATSTTYFYTDTVSRKLKRITTESPYYFKITNFYYEKYLLGMKTETDSNKITQNINFQTFKYEYYRDRKLKREIRTVPSEHCPGFIGNTTCEGIIEYKYDTEFPNDSTPIVGPPIAPLITVENKTASDIAVELWGYDDKGNKKRQSTTIWWRIKPDSTYELICDLRPDRNEIYLRKQHSYIPFKKDLYTAIEVFVYTTSNSPTYFQEEKEKVLFQEKYKLEALFKKPKTIKINKTN
jgi:hypothetical protein